MVEAPVPVAPTSQHRVIAAKYLKYAFFLGFQDNPDKASEETAPAQGRAEAVLGVTCAGFGRHDSTIRQPANRSRHSGLF